jgi:folate-dependent phosphoribosylglycinamide formyltransferase PurN
MRLAFITQEDSVAIPQNVESVIQINGVTVQLISIVDSSGSVTNRKQEFAKGFGIYQTLRMGMVLLSARLLCIVDGMFGYRLPIRKRSLKAVAHKNNIPYKTVRNANDEAFVEHLKSLDLDLIISFSCPTVFNERLLQVARLGCINLHCSYLPNYAGLLPSFWVLYHGEGDTGATVHYMDDKIDNGGILNQCRVSIDPGMTMFQLIRKTKAAGGELMVRTIKQLMNGEVQVKSNPVEKGTYFSWPTIKQMREFRRRGGRLI